MVRIIRFGRLRSYRPRQFWMTSLLRFGAVVIAVAALPALAFGSLCFTNHITPWIATGDFNRDGNIDVVVSPAVESFPFIGLEPNLEVYFGNGDGTFTGPTVLATGGCIFDSIVAADINGDGKLDLAASNACDGLANVFLGNGDGTFRGRRDFPAPGPIVIDDINRDGNPDMVVAGSQVAVFLGTRQGGLFGSPSLYPPGGNRAIVAGDMNGDGNLDVVTVGFSSLWVHPGNGDGSFQPPSEVALNKSTGREIVAADFDQDGDLDVALGTNVSGSSGIMVLPGKGNGDFGPSKYYKTANQSSTLHLRLGDFNADGKLDIVAANRLERTVATLLGSGSGSFVSGGAAIPVDYGWAVAAADLNGDGRSDIITENCVILSGPAAAAIASGIPAADLESAGAASTRFSPNPLRDRGTLGFTLPTDGKVSVHLYDIRGRRVHTMMESAWLPAGIHNLSLGRRATGLETGIYFYRVEAEGTRKSGSIVVVD